MKINREKLLELWALFDKLSQDKYSVKFHYTLLKNKRLLDPEVESLRKANEPPEEYANYEKKRIKVCNDFCEKDNDGTPKIDGNNFVIPEEVKTKFEEKLEELKVEYKSTLDSIEESKKEFNELLKEDVEIDFVSIPMSIIPEELVGQEVEILFDLIDEEK